MRRLMLAAMLLTCASPAMARAQARHVLVLSSSERPFAPQSTFGDALLPEMIRGSRQPIDFVEASIQDARAGGVALDVSIAERLHSAFGEKLDLVITVGGPAAQFAQKFRDRLFPGTPMLIAGVDRRFVDKGTFTANETTVAIEHDPALVVDEILRLLPGTRAVTVVVGASPIEQFWLQEMKREFRRFDGRVQFAWTNELSFAEIVERCRALPPSSAVFFALLALDAKGEPQVGSEALAALHAVASAPMFALYTGDLGNIVGGPLLVSGELSRTTAKVALRILGGESPGTIKTQVQRAGPPTYDWRELRRWNIPADRLTAQSVVLFRDPPVWRRYNPLIIAAVVIVPVIAIFLAVAFVTRGRTRDHESPHDAATRATNATVKLWTAGADGSRIYGDPHAKPWTAAMHRDEAARCAELYERAFARREPFQMEYRTRGHEGAERWILDTGLPRFSGEVFEGFVGSSVDVTRLGRARAELSNLSRHLIAAHERENAAVARKVHDDLCQRIMALTLQLRSMRSGPHHEDQQAAVDAITEQFSALVGELFEMPDPVYQKLELLGLTAAAERFCAQLTADNEVDVHFQHKDVPSALSPDVALNLFRVLQEAASNAVLHANARDVWVTLRGTGADVRLEVVDSGRGFDPGRDAPNGGVGLVAIRERLKLVKGDCTIESRPGLGTRVEAWVPLPQA